MKIFGFFIHLNGITTPNRSERRVKPVGVSSGTRLDDHVPIVKKKKSVKILIVHSTA